MANLAKMEAINDEEEDRRKFLCGFRDWTPKFMQRFAHIHWFLPFISIFSLIQGMAFIRVYVFIILRNLKLICV